MRILALSWGISDRRGGGEPLTAIETIRATAKEGADIDAVAPFVDAENRLPGNVETHQVSGGPRDGNTAANKLAMLDLFRQPIHCHRTGVAARETGKNLLRPKIARQHIELCERLSQGDPIPRDSSTVKAS